MRYWENLCNNCGLCCHEKAVLPDMLVIDMDRKCEFYSEDKSLCTVYKERFRKCNRCRKVTLFMAMFSSSLPPVCGYVQEMERLHIRFNHRKEFVLSNLD